MTERKQKLTPYRILCIVLLVALADRKSVV